MFLDLTLDRQGKVALYHQIAEQIKTRICDGRLPAGTLLPTVRQLAVDGLTSGPASSAAVWPCSPS